MQRSLKSFLLLVLVFTCVNVNAQSVIVLTDSADDLWIGKSVYYFEDESNGLTIEDVQHEGINKQFKKLEVDAPNFGNVQTTVWNKFYVVNNSSKKWVLSVLNYDIDTLVFHYKDNSDSYNKIIAGSSRPLSSRKYKTPFYTFDLPAKSGDTAVFYLKVQTYIFQYPMVVSSQEKYIEDLHINNLLKGLYYGFVILIIIYNLILFFSLKDRNYLYYIFYIFFTALLMAEHAGVIALVWGDKFHFLWNRGPLILSLAAIFFLLFSKSFLETKKNTPRANKVVNYGFIPLLCLSIVFNIIDKNLYASVINQVIGFGILLFMCVNAFIIYKRGFYSARFYILACSFYFVGVTIFILKTFAVIPYNLFTSNAMEIGSAIEMMLFSVSMADRISTFKKDKAKAQKELIQSLKENERLITEQNRVLEVKVDERTKALKETLHALELSQEELQQKNIVITKEKERSDHLLLNILPYETAQELKEKGSAAAKFYENVTVMFTDFKDFTRITEHMQPAELVAELDYCFRAFDNIVDKYDIEKIKTIGDSYMAAAGLPLPDDSGAIKIVKAAMELQIFMQQHNDKRTASGQKPFEIRIGIHTGSVIAGIVGSKKFAFDIWGDTVNTASRMESSGVPGKINISEATYACVKHHFNCTYRGKIVAKSKGKTDMYFVESEMLEVNKV